MLNVKKMHVKTTLVPYTEILIVPLFNDNFKTKNQNINKLLTEKN